MPEWTTHLSYLGVILVLVLTGAGLPIPEEVPVIAAGVASANGQLHPGLALLSCLVGAIAGDCVMYAIGYHFGRGIINEHPRLARLFHAERERQIERMIARHGWKVFLLARFLVGLRSPVYLTAGILRVPFRRFLVVDALCATLVVSVFFGLSYIYAPHIETIWRWVHNSQYAVSILAAVLVLAVVVWFWLHRRRKLPEEALVEDEDRPGSPNGRIHEPVRERNTAV